MRVDAKRHSALVFALLLPWAAAAHAAAGERTFEFQGLDKTYTNLAQDLAPIEQGSLAVQLSSPRNSLTVKSHQLRLQPAPDGSHLAHLEIEIFGKGWLIADVSAGPNMETRLQDELLILPQTLKFDGRAKLQRATGGYQVTAIEAPKTVTVTVQSKLSTGLVAFCDRISMLPFMTLDCPALERSLTQLTLPLPGPGGTYFVADSDLSEQDRGALDAYLAGK